MASIFQLPRAPETGLSRLGDVILGTAAEYAQNRRTDEREARQRQQRLSDVESDRAYARTEGDRQHGRARGERLADIKEERAYSEKEKETAMLRELERIGYLKRELRGDKDAIAAAFARAAADGTAARYKAAVDSGALSWGAILSGDEAAINAGLLAHTKRLSDEVERQRTDRENAQRTTDRLAGSDAENEDAQRVVRNRIQTTQAELKNPEPSRTELENRATQLAITYGSKTPGAPTPSEISSQEGRARAELRKEKEDRAWQQLKADEAELDALRYERASLATRLNVAGAKGVFPSLSEAPASATPTARTSVPPAAPAGPPRKTPEQFMEEVRTNAARRKAAASVAPAGNPGLAPQRAILSEIEEEFGGVPMTAAPRGSPSMLPSPMTAAPQSSPSMFSPPMTAAPRGPSLLTSAPEIPPAVEFDQLQRELLTISDLNSVTAQTIRNRMNQLRQRIPVDSRLSEPGL